MKKILGSMMTEISEQNKVEVEEFNELIAERCEEKLAKNKEYMKMQEQLEYAYNKHDVDMYSEISTQMQAFSTRENCKLVARDILTLLIID